MSANGTKSIAKITIDCPKCSTRFTVPMPDGEIMNSPKFSGFIATHELFTRCVSCKQSFALGIVDANVTWSYDPVPDEVVAALEESRIILPARSLGPH